MLALLSPAKKLDEGPFDHSLPITTTGYEEQTRTLHQIVRELSVEDLQSLMGISETLAALNHKRFQEMVFPFTKENAKPAALLFAGDTYVGLNASTWTRDDLVYAQDHVRILSGFYGLVRPLDLLQPYRLEMGTRLATKNGKNLYDFWGTLLTDDLNRSLQKQKSRYVVRLASDEYFSVIQPDRLAGPLITCVFKEWRNGQLKQISFYAKKARGMMARFMVQQRLDHPEGLQAFGEENYRFQAALSSPTTYVFTRDHVA